MLSGAASRNESPSTFTLEVDIAMTALARCAIERNPAAALVMAQIIGLTEFDHGLGMDLAASWYARGRRDSSEPGTRLRPPATTRYCAASSRGVPGLGPLAIVLG